MNKPFKRETTEAIELALHTIRIGNMAGNTVDYLLHRVSLGRWNSVDHDLAMGKRLA